MNRTSLDMNANLTESRPYLLNRTRRGKCDPISCTVCGLPCTFIIILVLALVAYALWVYGFNNGKWNPGIHFWTL